MPRAIQAREEAKDEGTYKAAHKKAFDGQRREQVHPKASRVQGPHMKLCDFVMYRTDDSRRLEMLPIADEYMRECLSIEFRRTTTAEDVLKTRTAGNCAPDAYAKQLAVPYVEKARKR